MWFGGVTGVGDKVRTESFNLLSQCRRMSWLAADVSVFPEPTRHLGLVVWYCALFALPRNLVAVNVQAVIWQLHIYSFMVTKRGNVGAKITVPHRRGATSRNSWRVSTAIRCDNIISR